MNNKTVYVLGAGFSVEAQIPSQEKLVEKIFELHENAPHLFDPLAMERFIHFLKDILYIPESDFSKVPLEDIFTPIDRCIMDNISFRELDVKEVIEIRNTVYYLIAKALDTLTTNQHQQYIRTFADHLVQKAKHRANNYKEVDPVCVISMNWDVLLDNEINRSLKDTPLESEGVVDYCCHMTAFAENDRATKPGLEVLSTGGFTVKLLKLHGSLNWLHCSRCLRLYVCLDKKIGLHHYDDQQACRHCEKNFPESGRASLLTSNLVMPTFLKNLSSPNLKLIWQNARN